jgi:hypothetical protein
MMAGSDPEIYVMELEAQNAELRNQLNDRTEAQAGWERDREKWDAVYERRHQEIVAAQDRISGVLGRIADALEACR